MCAAQTAPPQPGSQRPAQTQSAAAKSTIAAAKSTIVVPAGTTVSLALTNPILAKTAKSGDSVYAETAFPVAVNDQIAIPLGTYAQGQIDSVKRPGWLSPHAQLQVHFTKLIFANGYIVELPQPRNPASGQPAGRPASAAQGTAPAHADDVIAAVTSAYIDVSSASDILLDNGSQIEMVLQLPLRLNAVDIAGAVAQSQSRQLPQFNSATRCRPSPGTPGTSDTVIPGTPGSLGTPDTVIPGGPGMPDTVIPGIPATPGTPATVILGTPGTPGMACPGPPIVTSNSKAQNYKQSFQIGVPVWVSGKQLPAGSYQVTWKESGSVANVDILQNGSVMVSLQARVVLLNRQSPADAPGTRTNSDGSISLRSLRFAGQTFALYFDQGAR